MNFEDYDSAVRTAGYSAAGSFDYERGWRALLKYQNAHGGLAGREIIPVFFDLNVVSSETWPQQQQEQCAKWTQDDHVFAGLTWIFSSTILECLHEAGAAVVSLETVNTRAITPHFRQYPYFVAPTTITVDRAAAVMVDGLYKMGYFAAEEKLGLVTLDHPSFRYAVQNGLMPMLRRRGVSLADAAYLHYPYSLSEFAAVSNDAANAALRFKSQGIDHVVFIDAGSTAAFAFMSAAERQDYRPRYGLSSQSTNQLLVELLGGDAKNQLHGAMSVGWLPTYDVREQDDPHAKNATRVTCFSIMRKAGVELNSRNARDGALTICDGLWSLGAGLQEASIVNQATFLDGMNALQESYSPGSTWSTFLSPQRHDGASSVSNLRFVDRCTCFKYLGRPHRI